MADEDPAAGGELEDADAGLRGDRAVGQSGGGEHVQAVGRVHRHGGDGDRNVADRGIGDVIGQRRPIVAAVGGLPDAAVGRTDIVGVTGRIARIHGD